MKQKKSVTIEKIVKELALTFKYHREDYKTSLKFARMLLKKEDEEEFQNLFDKIFDEMDLFG